MSLETTWVRLPVQWVRADRIVGVRVDGPAEGSVGRRWADRDAQLMVRVADEDQPWQQAAVCPASRGEAMLASLLNLLGAPADGPRYIHLARREELDCWTADSAMPLTVGASDGIVGGLPLYDRAVNENRSPLKR